MRSTLTKDLIDQAVAIVQVGNFRQTARMALGVPHGTWAKWIARGKRDIESLNLGRSTEVTLAAELVGRLELAEAQAHQQILQDILLSDDLRLKHKFLEQRYSKLYKGQGDATETATADADLAREMLVDRMTELASKLKASGDG